jgi:hypothetical protein
MVLYLTLLYFMYGTALYCTVVYFTMLNDSVLYCTLLYLTELCCTLRHCAVLYWTVCVVLYYTEKHVPCCAVLFCTVLYCIILYLSVLCLLCRRSERNRPTSLGVLAVNGIGSSNEFRAETGNGTVQCPGFEWIILCV